MLSLHQFYYLNYWFVIYLLISKAKSKLNPAKLHYKHIVELLRKYVKALIDVVETSFEHKYFCAVQGMILTSMFAQTMQLNAFLHAELSRFQDLGFVSSPGIILVA